MPAASRRRSTRWPDADPRTGPASSGGASQPAPAGFLNPDLRGGGTSEDVPSRRDPLPDERSARCAKAVSDAPTRHTIRLAGRRILRPGEDRRGDAARLRHLPRLPALLQSVRQLPAPVRSDRHSTDGGEVEQVASTDFQQVVDACTLCDMCFMTKCPYVPPHDFDLDFPHLMLRYRAAEFRAGRGAVLEAAAGRRPTATDGWRHPSRRSPIGRASAATRLTRPLMEKTGRRPPRGAPARIPRPHLRGPRPQGERRRSTGTPRLTGARRCSTPPASLTTTIPRIGEATQACSPATASRPRSSIRRLLRHAAVRVRRSRPGRGAAPERVAADTEAVDRQGLRRRRAGPVLRADVEVRVAAARAGR